MKLSSTILGLILCGLLNVAPAENADSSALAKTPLTTGFGNLAASPATDTLAPVSASNAVFCARPDVTAADKKVQLSGKAVAASTDSTNVLTSTDPANTSGSGTLVGGVPQVSPRPVDDSTLDQIWAPAPAVDLPNLTALPDLSTLLSHLPTALNPLAMCDWLNANFSVMPVPQSSQFEIPLVSGLGTLDFSAPCVPITDSFLLFAYPKQG